MGHFGGGFTSNVAICSLHRGGQLTEGGWQVNRVVLKEFFDNNSTQDKQLMKKEMKQLYLLSAAFVIFILLIVGVYIFNFNSLPISKNSSDWGALGDYFGGMLNPIISALTLIFVGKTYITQKTELERLSHAATEADKRSERATTAQTEMAKSYLDQIKAVDRNAKITTITSKINFSLQLVGIYQEEMTRLVNASNNHKTFHAMDGKPYMGERMLDYKENLGTLIINEQSKINNFIKEVDELTKF